MKRLIALFSFIILSFSAQAQRPDLPGQLLVDFGFNSMLNAPTDIDLNFLPSNTFSFNYFYDFPVGEKGWTFSPGIGLSLEQFDFKNNKTLVSNINTSTGTRTIEVVDLSEELGSNLSFNKSQLGLNYIDIPIEFRWFANRNEYSKGFRLAVGGKVSYLYSSFTKVKFKDALGEGRMIKDRQTLGFNNFRYGAQVRAGWGGFGFFAFYELSKKWKTPPAGGADASALTIGLSLTAF